MDKEIPENSLGQKEPMCIDNKCKCEWPGNLLNFK